MVGLLAGGAFGVEDHGMDINLKEEIINNGYLCRTTTWYKRRWKK